MAAPLHCDCPGSPRLQPRELLPGLFAQACPDCGALSLELEDYRRWLAGRQAGPAPTPEQWIGTPVAEHLGTRQVRLCAACGRPMGRYRAGTHPDFHLDRCAPCQRLVLDGGEWEALAQLGAAEHLEQILSEPWQRRLQTLEAGARRRQALRQRLGDASVDELLRIQDWLQDHPQRRELLALLNGDPI